MSVIVVVVVVVTVVKHYIDQRNSSRIKTLCNDDENEKKNRYMYTCNMA